LIYESKVFIDEASPWVPELNPFKTSLTTNPSLLVILKIPVLGFQFWTVPLVLLIDPSTISPLAKSLGFNLTSNVGINFWGTILAEELIKSNVPAEIPGANPAKYSERLYVTVPIPP